MRSRSGPAPTWRRWTVGLAAVGLGLVAIEATSARAIEIDQPDRFLGAVAFDGDLICLLDGGRFAVWHLDDGRFDLKTSSRMTLRGATHLATDGKQLVAASNAKLYAWSPAAKLWRRLASFNAGNGEIESLAVVDGLPVIVFPSLVATPTSGRIFEVPGSRTPGRPPLRVLATHAAGSAIWIGTGHGEWGGDLWSLDLRTGRWDRYHDPLHYVTGITLDEEGRLIVSWSMHHFLADCLIRVHDHHARLKRAYPELRWAYFPGITFSRFGETLYGIENADLVLIRQGIPSRVATLTGPLYRNEPMAIGVAPGVLALIPVAPKTLIVIPYEGMPLRVEHGSLSTFRRSLPVALPDEADAGTALPGARGANHAG